jgi:hypothetical protein
MDDRGLERVARIYNEAAALAQQPNMAVQGAYNVSRATAVDGYGVRASPCHAERSTSRVPDGVFRGSQPRKRRERGSLKLQRLCDLLDSLRQSSVHGMQEVAGSSPAR